MNFLKMKRTPVYRILYTVESTGLLFNKTENVWTYYSIFHTLSNLKRREMSLSFPMRKIRFTFNFLHFPGKVVQNKLHLLFLKLVYSYGVSVSSVFIHGQKSYMYVIHLNINSLLNMLHAHIRIIFIHVRLYLSSIKILSSIIL